MQYLDEHMDDLLKRAGEDYPLSTGNSNWQAVLEKIKDEDDKIPAALLPAKNTGYKKILLWTLLLVLSFALYKYRVNDNQKKWTKNDIATVATEESKTDIPTTKAAGKIAADGYKEQQRNTNVIILKRQGTGVTREEIQQLSLDTTETFLNKEAAINVTDGKDDSVDDFVNFHEKLEPHLPVLLLAPTEILGERQLTKTVLSDPASQQAKVAAGGKKQTKSMVLSRGLYGGVSAGLSVSKGASLGFGKPGLEGGFLLGYRFNKTLSIESGISAGNKNYTSSGKDFSMDKIKDAMPSGMIVNDLKSKTSVIEIALKARFNVYSKAASSLFITGGLGTYIITKEFNQYNVSANGQQDKLTGMYTRNTYVMPAAGIISAGYQKSISKKINLRIEPFLKVPLKGIGVGNLQVTTTGVQLSLISNF